MDPEYPGYYVWACHETSNLPANIELHDARTGQLLFGWGKNKDTGRSRAADIDPTYPGYELWGSTATVPMNIGGEKIADGFNEFYTRLSDGTYQMNEDGTYMQGTLPVSYTHLNPFRYCGEYFDGETESLYLRARYYSPVSGRFITCLLYTSSHRYSKAGCSDVSAGGRCRNGHGCNEQCACENGKHLGGNIGIRNGSFGA